MESWQKNIIMSKLPELIALTRCDDLLLSKLLANRVIAHLDFESIKAEKTNTEKSMRLYTVCQTRANGFSVLASSLQQCNQMDAFELLQAAFLQQDPKVILHTALSLPSDKSILNALSTHTIQSVVDENKQTYVETFLLNSPLSNCSLYKNTLPFQAPYYIPRTISNRVVLNPTIFRVLGCDVFVLKGIDHHELTELADGELTAPSSTQTEKLDRRFILWEDDHDFDDICALAKDKNLFAHLVKVEALAEEDIDSSSCDGDDNIYCDDIPQYPNSSRNRKIFVVEKSSGYSEVLMNYAISKNNKKDLFWTEEKFVESIDEVFGRGFCICDSPGMGKSWVLGSIARKIAAKYLDHLVVFFPLSNFDVQENNLSNPESDVIGMVSTGFSHKLLVQGVLQGDVQLDIFLDGFDEIKESAAESTINFIRQVLENQSKVRIFVTSRPHMRRKLETSMGIVAYDIHPFTKNDQISFFETFWSNDLEKNAMINPGRINYNRLKEFAAACQVSIRDSLTHEEKDALGIPLHCYVLATVLSKNAEKYTTRPATTLTRLIDTSFKLGTMYKQFMEISFAKGNEISSKVAKSYHVWRALSQFSSELATTFEAAYPVDKDIPEEEILKYGVLEVSFQISNKPKTMFVHRTFAEYLLAELVCRLCHESYLNPKLRALADLLLKFLINEVFNFKFYFRVDFTIEEEFYAQESMSRKPRQTVTIMEPANRTLPLLFDAQLSSFSSQPICEEILHTLCNELRPHKLYRIVIYSAKSGYQETIRFFKDFLLKTQIQPKLMQFYAPFFHSNVDVSPSSLYSVEKDLIPASVLLINIASKYSGSRLISECVDIYGKCLGENIIQTLCSEVVWCYNPLNLALRRGDYDSVEYYLQKKMQLDGRCYLYYCLSNTNNDNPKRIEEKLKICKLLLGTSTKLMYEKAHTEMLELENPLATPNMSFVLYKYLAETFPEQILSTVSEQIFLSSNTIKYSSICSVVNGMFGDDLHKICEFLIETMDVPQAFKPKEGHEFPLSRMFQHCCNINPETVSLILSLFDENEILKYANTLLYSATVECPSFYELFFQKGITLDMIQEKEEFTRELLRNASLPVLSYLTSNGLIINTDHAFDGPFNIPDDKYPSVVKFLLQFGISNDSLRTCFNHIIRMLSGNFSPRIEFNFFRYYVNEYNELISYLLTVPDAVNVLTITNLDEPDSFCQFTQLLCCMYISFPSIKLLWEYCQPETKGLIEQLSKAQCIHKAIENEQGFEVVRFFVEKNIDYHSKDEADNTILHLSVELGEDTKLVQYILDKLEIPVNDINVEGCTPLHYSNSWNIAKILLDHNALPFVKNNEGQTFLSRAATWNNEIEIQNVLSVLREKHGVTDDTLQTLVTTTNSSLVSKVTKLEHKTDELALFNSHKTLLESLDAGKRDQYLLKLSKDNQWDVVNWFIQTRQTDISSETLKSLCTHALEIESFETLQLINSISNAYLANSILKCENIKMARFLQGQAVDVSATDSEGENFLHKASQLDVDKFLDFIYFVKHECDQERLLIAWNCEGRTALHSRISNANQFTPRYIFEEFCETANYDIDARDTGGNSLLMSATKNWKFVGLQGIEVILEHGANPHLRSNKNENLMHFAVTSEDIEAVEICLNLGIMPNNRIIERFTPFDLVMHMHANNTSENKLQEIIEILLDSILSTEKCVAAQDRKYGNTFLHQAALFALPQIFHLVLEKVIQRGYLKYCYVENKLGMTPLHVYVASISASKETLNLLIENGININELSSTGRTLWYELVIGFSQKVPKHSVNKGLLNIPEPYENTFDMIGILMNAGLEPKLQDRNGNTLLHLISKLLPKLKSSNARRETQKLFREIIQHFQKQNQGYLFHISNAKGQLPVHLVAKHFWYLPPFIKVFGQTRVNFDKGDRNGKSVLMYAIEGTQSIKMLKGLIRQSRELDAVDRNGNNFLNYLAKHFGELNASGSYMNKEQTKYRSNETFHKLINFLAYKKKHSLFKQANKNGEYPAEFAVRYVRCLDTTVLNLMVDDYASSDQLDKLLQICVKHHRSPKIFQYLLEHGAQYRSLNLLHECCRNGLVLHVEYLLNRGHSVSSVDLFGNNCLHYTLQGCRSLCKNREDYVRDCFCSVYKTISLLLSKECNPHQRNVFGKTPHCMALELQQEDLVALFRGALQNMRRDHIESSRSALQ